MHLYASALVRFSFFFFLSLHQHNYLVTFTNPYSIVMILSKFRFMLKLFFQVPNGLTFPLYIYIFYLEFCGSSEMFCAWERKENTNIYDVIFQMMFFCFFLCCERFLSKAGFFLCIPCSSLLKLIFTFVSYIFVMFLLFNDVVCTFCFFQSHSLFRLQVQRKGLKKCKRIDFQSYSRESFFSLSILYHIREE